TGSRSSLPRAVESVRRSSGTRPSISALFSIETSTAERKAATGAWSASSGIEATTTPSSVMTSAPRTPGAPSRLWMMSFIAVPSLGRGRLRGLRRVGRDEPPLDQGDQRLVTRRDLCRVVDQQSDGAALRALQHERAAGRLERDLQQRAEVGAARR